MVFNRSLYSQFSFNAPSEDPTWWSTAVFLPPIPDSNVSSAGRIAFLNSTQTVDDKAGSNVFSLKVFGWSLNLRPLFTLLDTQQGGVVPNPGTFQGMLIFRNLVIARDGTWVMAGGFNLGPNPLCFYNGTRVGE
jgi:hypothetical protein